MTTKFGDIDQELIERYIEAHGQAAAVIVADAGEGYDITLLNEKHTVGLSLFATSVATYPRTEITDEPILLSYAIETISVSNDGDSGEQLVHVNLSEEYSGAIQLLGEFNE